MLEPLRAVVPQQDREHLEVDDPLQQLADALQQVVEIEDAGDLARDLVQHGQRLRLARHARVKPRILHRDSHARGGQLQQPLVLLGEVAGCSDWRSMTPTTRFFTISGTASSDCTFGIGVDVVLDRAHVLHQDGPALGRGLPHDAAAQLDAHPLHLRRMAGLEAHAQVARCGRSPAGWRRCGSR